MQRTNSRKHENLRLRYAYRDENPECELSKWMARHYRAGLTERELTDESADVHHIFSMGSRPDLWTNLITLSRPIHAWCHRCPVEGRIVALHRKLMKKELDLKEFRRASGMRLEGWLLSHETAVAPLRPLHAELLSFAERE